MIATVIGGIVFVVFGVILGLIIGYLLFGKGGDEE